MTGNNLEGMYIVIVDGKIKYVNKISKIYEKYCKGIDSEGINEIEDMSKEELIALEKEMDGRAIFRILGTTLRDSEGNVIGFRNDLESEMKYNKKNIVKGICSNIPKDHDTDEDEQVMIDWSVTK